MVTIICLINYKDIAHFEFAESRQMVYCIIK